MAMLQIFNVMVEFFEEDGWDFQWMEGISVLSMGYNGKNGKWLCYAQAREPQQQFVFYSVVSANAPEHKRLTVAEYITRANYGMVIGNFEMDFEDGEIRYKTSIDVEGADLSMPLIRQVVYSNLIITDRYLPGLMKVIYADIEPVAALEGIEDLSDLDDDDPQSSDEGYDDFDDDEDDPFAYLDDYDDEIEDDTDPYDDSGYFDGYEDDEDENYNPFDDDEPPGSNGN